MVNWAEPGTATTFNYIQRGPISYSYLSKFLDCFQSAIADVSLKQVSQFGQAIRYSLKISGFLFLSYPEAFWVFFSLSFASVDMFLMDFFIILFFDYLIARGHRRELEAANKQ